MDELIITTSHLYSVPAWNGRIGFCARDSRTWFRRHGLDWSDFVTQGGLPASVFEATGDALALQLVAHARRVECEKAEHNNQEDGQ